jgi:carbon-monoxide dehydrogenase small subunit
MSKIKLTVNGKAVSRDVPDNMLLSEFLREDLRLTGTHIGCDTSQCGACVVHIDGRAVKSCATLTVSLEGADITTIEGVAQGGELHPMQQAFNTHHGLQCGFCTPGMIMAGIDMVNRYQAAGKPLTEATIRAELEGNICRCTGYHNIVKAIEDAAGTMTGMAKAAE